MLKKNAGPIAGIILLLLLASGVITELIKFFEWLFLLKYSEPEVSVTGGIIVRILTFAVTFGLVGVVFESIGWFNSKCMKFFYWIISTLISFVLAYIVWQIEEHITIIGIIFGIFTVGSIAFFVIRGALEKRKVKSKKENSEAKR